VLGLHRAEDNLDVAKRENASILLEENYEKTYEGFDPYSPEGHIILSMYQNAHLERSILFGTYVENSVKQMSKLPSRGVKQAGFLVLRETTMPSVLIETGFLSTDLDEEYLTKRANQEEMASCILRAFGQYKKAVEEEEARTVAIVTTVKDSTPVKVAPVTHGGISNDGGIMIYRIQVAASSKSAVDARFQSLQDLEIIKEDELYKFMVGHFTSHEAARPRLAELKAKGFQGAFIVAYKDGRRIRA
jgi:N-acetylmuramoyl-L-alanine amidase